MAEMLFGVPIGAAAQLAGLRAGYIFSMLLVAAAILFFVWVKISERRQKKNIRREDDEARKW